MQNAFKNEKIRSRCVEHTTIKTLNTSHTRQSPLGGAKNLQIVQIEDFNMKTNRHVTQLHLWRPHVDFKSHQWWEMMKIRNPGRGEKRFLLGLQIFATYRAKNSTQNKEQNKAKRIFLIYLWATAGDWRSVCMTSAAPSLWSCLKVPTADITTNQRLKAQESPSCMWRDLN